MNSFFLGLLVGIAIGASAMVLLTLLAGLIIKKKNNEVAMATPYQSVVPGNY